ncbi:Type I secretion system, outer membrane component LapE [Acinetobacter sp. neg1]|nr:TolC family protein [Acinetobacter sp. neg1]KHF78789.1 Type I secretion system, outer membrane component LapE [Acinetobacter sp. neg1]
MHLIKPSSVDEFNKINFKKISSFQLNSSLFEQNFNDYNDSLLGSKIEINEAIKYALNRNPDISQAISGLAGQNASIDIAKAGYYPQISGGIITGDLSSGNRGQQVITLSATQMLFDFGKVKSAVEIEQAKVQVEQANVLVKFDAVASDVAQTIVKIQRYRQLNKIAEQQIAGIQRIQEIANLRARAGVTSQADPIQAQSYLQAAQSTLIAQQLLLNQYQLHLQNLLGFDVSKKNWIISSDLAKLSELYRDPEFNTIPKMIVAQLSAEVAKAYKEQARLARYPTLALKGSISQAINNRNPNNMKDDGLYSSVMLEATSQFYQGGVNASQVKRASYAEEAAKAQVNSVYMDILDQIRTSREQIENKKHQMHLLTSRQLTTIATRELYQEQYKLGTRSLVDLLNAEQAIHSANSELESARYDIYSGIVQYIEASGRSRQVYGLNNISIQGVEVQP